MRLTLVQVEMPKRLDIVPSNLRRPYDVRCVIETVADAGSF